MTTTYLRQLLAPPTRDASVQVSLRGGEEIYTTSLVALVAPIVVTPMGGQGPELVTEVALRNSTPSWAGMPVLPVHPTSGSQAISAHNSGWSDRFIGRVLAARFDSGRLIFDVEIERRRLEALTHIHRTDETLRNLQLVAAGQPAQPLELSIGGYVSVVARPGRHDGQDYNLEWQAVQPDHLALGLDGHEGACSVSAGCGALRPLQQTTTATPTPASPSTSFTPQSPLHHGETPAMCNFLSTLTAQQIKTLSADQQTIVALTASMGPVMAKEVATLLRNVMVTSPSPGYNPGPHQMALGPTGLQAEYEYQAAKQHEAEFEHWLDTCTKNEDAANRR